MDAFFAMLTQFIITYGPTFLTIYAAVFGVFFVCFFAVFITVLRMIWSTFKAMDNEKF